MSDQHAAFASGCYGHTVVKTPNIDRLASEGVRCDNAYTTSPVCVPARFSAMCGQYPHTTGCLFSTPLPVDVRTAAHMFRDHGYLTAFIGKMHPCEPQTYGYDFLVDMGHYYDYLGPKTEVFARGMGAKDTGSGMPWMNSWYRPHSWHDEPLSPQMPSVLDDADHFEAFVARNCESFLTRYGHRPFFLFASLLKPHHPFFAPPEYHAMYPPEEMELPETALDWANVPDDARHKLATELADQGEEALRKAQATISAYYACTTYMDECVGRILATLDRLGLAENTIVVYTSDHGEMLYDYGLRGKFVFYERSARVPLIVRHPGQIAAGTSTDALIDFTDLVPTSLGLAGLENTDRLDGVDQSQVIRSEIPRLRDACFSELRDRIMIRTERWKLCRYPGEQWYLYDMVNDPAESTNLYEERRNDPEIVACRERLLAWKAEPPRYEGANKR